MKQHSGLLPAPHFARPYLSTDAAEKTWTCPQCGEIQPFELVGGFYTRRMCPCERRAREEQEREAIRHLLLRSQAEQTYSWLGRSWREEGLVLKTFASFQRERQLLAYNTTWRFTQDPHGVLALYGPFGVGKTHLLAAIANQLCLAGKACLFASAVTLFDAIQDRMQHKEDYHELLKQAIHTPVLLLDDMDKPKPSDFREATLYQIINKRVSAERPLAISSNCMPHELDRVIGEGARSRLMMALEPVPMAGTDYRLERSA